MLILLRTFAACDESSFDSIPLLDIFDDPTDHFFILTNTLCKSDLSQTLNPNPNPTTLVSCDASAYRDIPARLENPTTTYSQTSPELGNFGSNIQQHRSPRCPHSGSFGGNPHASRLKLRRDLQLWPRCGDIIIFVIKGCVIAIIPLAFFFLFFLVKGSAVTVVVGQLFFRFRMLVVGPLIPDDGVVVAAFNSVSCPRFLI